MEQIEVAAAIEWLMTGEHSRFTWTGISSPPLAESLFVLHAIYQDPSNAQEVADEVEEAAYEQPSALKEETASALAAKGWQRVRWRDLLSTHQADVAYIPGRMWLRSSDLDGPEEGGLDRGSYDRLGELLIATSPAGRDTPCTYFWAASNDDWGGAGVARSGTLADLAEAYPMGRKGSPNNLARGPILVRAQRLRRLGHPSLRKQSTHRRAGCRRLSRDRPRSRPPTLHSMIEPATNLNAGRFRAARPCQ